MVLATADRQAKTISLYTCLHILNRPTSTSRPRGSAEIQCRHQPVNINEKAGSLRRRAALVPAAGPRHHMVAKSDLETAEISVKAAQTGTCCCPRCHTNDAPSTLIRLANRGVAPFKHRLVRAPDPGRALARRLCRNASARGHPARGAPSRGILRGDLDGTCNRSPGPVRPLRNTGYKGRVGLRCFAGLGRMRQLIMRNGSVTELPPGQCEGLSDLRHSGLRSQGRITSLEEIEAVTNE